MSELLPYRIVGKGKPVMLVHGFGEDSHIWKYQEAFLQDKVQLIIPDLPQSAKFKGESGKDVWRLDDFAESLLAILDKEKIEKATIIGHSMGGYITMAFAERHMDRLTSFGLFHSSAYADSEEKKATRRKGIEFIREHGAFAFLKTSTPNLYSPNTKENNPDIIEEHISWLNNFSADALVNYYEAMMARPDRTETLRKSTVPVLFIMGKYDVAVPVEQGLEQCHLPDIVYIHILSQSGHMGMLEEMDASNLALEKFLL